MSQQAWAIYAWSPSTNQRVRQFRLADVTTNYTQQQAQQHADAFAGIQNRDQYMLCKTGLD